MVVFCCWVVVWCVWQVLLLLVGVVDYVLLGVEICIGLFCVGVCCSAITDNMLGHGGPG